MCKDIAIGENVAAEVQSKDKSAQGARKNPMYVIVRAPEVCESWGLECGVPIATTQKTIIYPDGKGYQIRVYSPKHNCSVSLLSHQYEPVLNNTQAALKLLAAVVDQFSFSTGYETAYDG